MSHIIDARGKACPTPVLLAKQAIGEGVASFSILVDNRAAVENLTRLATSQGFDIRTDEAEGGFCLAFSQNGVAPQPEAVATAHPGSSYVVFVGQDIIGGGDRELGTNLMRMFFYTLAQSDDLPASILFMNAGVKLPALDSQVAEHLRTLADKGVEVHVCGTCLNFYGIADSLQVGMVSNMYDIVSRMQGADKVISL